MDGGSLLQVRSHGVKGSCRSSGRVAWSRGVHGVRCSAAGLFSLVVATCGDGRLPCTGVVMPCKDVCCRAVGVVHSGWRALAGGVRFSASLAGLSSSTVFLRPVLMTLRVKQEPPSSSLLLLAMMVAAGCARVCCVKELRLGRSEADPRARSMAVEEEGGLRCR